jgi:hypothetical protein
MKTAIEELQEMVESKLTMPMGLSFKELFEQAKQMEKQQMIKFANDFLFHDDTDLTAEQYYNETFKI